MAPNSSAMAMWNFLRCIFVMVLHWQILRLKYDSLKPRKRLTLIFHVRWVRLRDRPAFPITLVPNTGMENPSEMSLDKRAVEPSHNVCLFSLPRQQGRDSLLLQAGSTEQPQNVSKSIHYTETLVEGGEEETVSTRLLPSSLRQIEPKEKNIKCDFCSYATHRKSHLNEHYRNIHLKVKVICDLCGKEFSSKLYIMKS